MYCLLCLVAWNYLGEVKFQNWSALVGVYSNWARRVEHGYIRDFSGFQALTTENYFTFLSINLIMAFGK